MNSTCQNCGKFYCVKPYLIGKSKYCCRKCQLEFYCKNKKNEDLTGQRFGKLTIISLNGRTKDKSLTWNCVCDCGGYKKTTTKYLRNGVVKSCGCLKNPSYAESLKIVALKLEKNVKKNENGCLEWQGSLKKKGYGDVHFQGKQIYAHRASWLVHKGNIPIGICVLHHCDNRACVNIEHLYLGNLKDNSRDMYERKRRESTKYAKGEKTGNAKLTEEDVENIYKMKNCGLTQKQIGQIFGVCQYTVWAIFTRIQWKHLKLNTDQ